MNNPEIDRRRFIGQAAGIGAGAALALSAAAEVAPRAAAAEKGGAKPTRVGIIGCGSVSGVYLPHLSAPSLCRADQHLRYQAGGARKTGQTNMKSPTAIRTSTRCSPANPSICSSTLPTCKSTST